MPDIIIVEDNKEIGTLLCDFLRRENYTVSLADTGEKEQELQKEKKTIILSLAHDLKTPLSEIRLYNKALSENLYDTPEKRAQVYAGIDKNVTEMEGYVTEIMAASREDFLNLTVEMGEVYLSSVMEYINAYYTDKLSNLHTTFEVESYLDCLLYGDSSSHERHRLFSKKSRSRGLCRYHDGNGHG